MSGSGFGIRFNRQFPAGLDEIGFSHIARVTAFDHRQGAGALRHHLRGHSTGTGVIFGDTVAFKWIYFHYLGMG